MEMREQAQDVQNLQATTSGEAVGSAQTQQPEITIEETVEVEITDADTAGQDSMATAPHHITLEELAETLREVAKKDPAEISGEEIRRLRQQFNALRKDTKPEADQADQAEPDPAREALAEDVRQLLEAIRENKNQWIIEQEKIKADNLAKKNALIDEINNLAADTDNVNRTFPRYRELVEAFTAIGEVPATDETDLWKRFSAAREQYSDNLKINKELRDYDFKKNLEAKEALLAEAEKLVEHPDLIEAYRKLSELHDQWRRIGPVAKEIREEIWEKFKNFSTEIRRRYQEHFEARKEEEQKNEQAKTALCEQLEAIDIEQFKSPAAWEKATEQVKEIQQQWRQIGFASRKINNALFARYRACCDKFFEAKANFFKETREALSANLELKKAIVEKAEALKDSEEWRKATDEFVAMQQQWKTIGPVARKAGEELWQRFISACDHFFDRKKQQGSGVRQEQQANLQAKTELIEKIEAVADDATRDVILDTLKSSQQQWQQIGHVPFKEKDKLYDRYRAALDRLRSMLDRQHSRARMDRFQSSVAELEGDESKLSRERDRLMRAAENLRAEIRTYENNLGFLSSKSKSGDTMVREFQRRIDRSKAELEALTEKIRVIDAKL